MSDAILFGKSVDFPINDYGDGLERMASVEVEVKALLSSRAAMILSRELDPYFLGKESQLNHYFKATESSITNLNKALPEFCGDYLEKCSVRAIVPSVRTREVNGDQVYLIFKASIGDGSSENGLTRIEHEKLIDTPIAALDQLLVDCGMAIRSKWSRDRWTYKQEGLTICLDKNSGYGWLVEVEKLVKESEVNAAKQEVLDFLAELGLQELDSGRLERMFAYYEANWGNYYGTDRTFTLE